MATTTDDRITKDLLRSALTASTSLADVCERLEVTGSVLSRLIAQHRLELEADRFARPRNNSRLTLDGETKSIREWAKISGVRPEIVRYRLWAGWTLERAVRTPVKKRARTIEEDF